MCKITYAERQLNKCLNKLKKAKRRSFYETNPEIEKLNEQINFWKLRIEHDRNIELAKASAPKIDNRTNELNLFKKQ